MPVDHASLAGYAAATGEPLVIADVYLLPDDVSYKQNRSFDEKFGYRTKSMLVIPMKTHRDEIIGVLQLINRKRDPNVKLSTPVIVEREVETLRPARRRAGERARVAGGGRDREQPAVRGHRAAVRGIRHRRGHGDRSARPHHVGSLEPRGDAHRRTRRSGRPRRRRTVPRPAVLARAAPRAPLRRTAARFRQGRRARGSARQGEEALPARPRAHSASVRLSHAAVGARLRARARRAARLPRPRRARRHVRAARATRAGARTPS